MKVDMPLNKETKTIVVVSFYFVFDWNISCSKIPI